MHIYNIFTFNLLQVQERQPNIFGRGAYGGMLAWYGYLYAKLGDT